MSYISKRSQTVKYKNFNSNPFNVPFGGPQDVREVGTPTLRYQLQTSANILQFNCNSLQRPFRNVQHCTFSGKSNFSHKTKFENLNFNPSMLKLNLSYYIHTSTDFNIKFRTGNLKFSMWKMSYVNLKV